MISAIIMASGFGRRMAKDKLLLPLQNKTILEYVLDTVSKVPFDEVILVAANEEYFKPAMSYNIQCVKNKNPEAGQSMSVRLGVEAAKPTNACMFFVADQPLLSTSTIKKLIAKHQANPDCIIVPCQQGQRKNPTIFPTVFRGELLLLSGDAGGRTIIRQHPQDTLFLEFDDPLSFFDVDTMENYQEIQRLMKL